MKHKAAILTLEDGMVYKGWSTSKHCTIVGEIVFTTGITGYQEIMTDPSYSGQIIVFTYPEIGNTGINLEDSESSKVQCNGIIIRNLCDYPSNWRAGESLSNFAEKHNIPILYGLDTRQLTQHLRGSGAMNACISNEILEPSHLLQQLKATPSMQGLDLVKTVTTAKSYKWTKPSQIEWNFNYKVSPPQAKVNPIVVIDFGIKYNILRYLSTYGYEIIVLPAQTSVKEILSYHPSGILLSNGPGDPAAVTYAITNVKALLNTQIPIFGICMGHQILSLALGAQTFKLKFGHRGINHPAGAFQKIEITSQNHGFAVSANPNLDDSVKITHYNLNDWTIAGIAHKSLPVFSVQYHPEASPGPHDAEYLFNIFSQLIFTHEKNLKPVA